MNAEIITIGDEILIGQISDSNAAFIGKELTKIGIEVNRITTIKDNPESILETLGEAGSRAGLVIVSGGLGPTKDDKTKAAFSRFFDDQLVADRETLDHIRTLFSKIGEPLLQSNIDQAKVPSKARILKNKYGTAPGLWFEKKGVVFISLPGVPYEMKALMADEVLPALVVKFKREYILQKTVLTYGVGESRVADRIADWENSLPENMSLAYLPSPGCVRLRLMARGQEEQKLKGQLKGRLKALDNIIGNIIGGYEDGGSLLERIAHKLTVGRKTLALAESCTGGKIASLFTGMPGASAYFKGALIPYSTSIKERVLGVSPEIIKTYSVVSAQTAEAMARQARKLFQSDFALATTGNAGPAKGDSAAEIGTVYIALASQGNLIVREFHLGNHRDKVVGKAVQKALEIIHNALPEGPSENEQENN